MTAADHILAALLAALSIALIYLRPAAPESHSRTDLYLSGALSGLVYGGAPLLLHHAAGRPLATFGLSGWETAAADAAAALLWALLLLIGARLVLRGALRRRAEPVYRRYAWLMPRTRGELGASWIASAAAGVGEEIAYRGFLLVYAAALIGPLPGLLASSLLFGAAHGYQRRFGMVFASLAGLVLGGVYLASGSLPLVMFMHAAYNVASFTVGRAILASPLPGDAD